MTQRSANLGERIRRALPAVRARPNGASDLWEALGQEIGESPEATLAGVCELLDLPPFSCEQLSTFRLDEASSAESCRSHGVFVGFDSQGRRAVVAADPWNESTLRWLQRELKTAGPTALARRADIDACLAAVARVETAAANSAASPADGAEALRRIDSASVAGEPNAVVKFVDRVILSAWARAASDIHFETERNGIKVRIRIDGVLSDLESMSDAVLSRQVVSRLKVLAELDISEQRVPQDGRFRLKVAGRAVDFRVSVMPSAHGEDVVLRILDKRNLVTEGGQLQLEGLGFNGRVLARLRELSRRSHGMLLVTGPTGSGKTTTLYALLSEIKSGLEKIVTIEDPIEYEIASVLQVPVNEKKGLTFARGLRSILRHDPDLIMIGEIRDHETADIAVQAALTGHLVFATVHANNIFDVIGRFLHMGIDLYSFMSSLNGVLSQRLVRTLCSDCKRSVEHREGIEVPSSTGASQERQGVLGYAPGSCERCQHTGYRGRVALGEIVAMDDTLRDMVVRRAPVVELKQYLRSVGTMTLEENAKELFESGRTTYDELRHVVVSG